MGIIDYKDGYLLFTGNMTLIPMEKTYIIMSTKIQRWWRDIRYKNLVKKAHKKRRFH